MVSLGMLVLDPALVIVIVAVGAELVYISVR